MVGKHIIPALMAVAVVASLSSCASLKRLFSSDQSEYLTGKKIAAGYEHKGTIREIFYKCSVPGPTKRRMLVYLPEGYSSEKTYPVMYLLHGARGNETSWLRDGNALYILDSLFENGLAEKAIAVFPNMNQYDDDEDAYQSRFKKPFESFFESNGAVESSFCNDVVKTVDRMFNTIPDKNHRALIGLSIGAFQAIHISAANPDTFGYIGLFSPFCKAPVRNGEYRSFYDNLRDKQKIQFRDPPERYSIYIGYWDVFSQHTDYMKRSLGERGFKYQYHMTGGGHDWPYWRMFLTEFAQELFK